MLALRPNRRPTIPWAACPRPGCGRRRWGGGAPPQTFRRTRSTGLAKRGRRWDGEPRCRSGDQVPPAPL